MGPDDELSVALRNVAPDGPFAILFKRACEQHNAVSGFFEDLPGREIMLLSKDLGRRHERDLISVFNRDDGGLERDNRLAGADIALEQPAHRKGRLHVGGNFLEHALLRAGRMKWQYLLYRFSDAGPDLEGDASARSLLAPLEFEAEFDEEQFVKDQPDVRGCTRGLKIAEALASVRPVNLRERFAWSDQAKMGSHCGWNRVGSRGAQIVERPAYDASKPARRKLALAGGFVDGNNASDFERGGGFFLGLVGAAVFVDIAEQFKLWLDNLQFAIAILFHFAVESDHLTGLEAVLKIRRVEPKALEAVASLSDRELKDRHSAGTKQAGIAHFGDDRGHLARAEFGNRARIEPVFVSEGQIVEEVVHRVQTLGGKYFGEPRTNPFDVLNRSGQFQHLRGC